MNFLIHEGMFLSVMLIGGCWWGCGVSGPTVKFARTLYVIGDSFLELHPILRSFGYDNSEFSLVFVLCQLREGIDCLFGYYVKMLGACAMRMYRAQGPVNFMFRFEG